MPNQRFIVLTFLAVALAIGATVRSATVSILLWTGQADPMLAGFLPASSIAGVLGGVIGFFVLLGNRPAVQFTDEVIGELAKVTWPTREETLNASVTVVFTTTIFLLSLGLFDTVWSKVTEVVLFNLG